VARLHARSLALLAAVAPFGFVGALAPGEFLEEYCIDCHDASLKRGELDLEPLVGVPLSEHPELWEEVLRRIDARQMPPPEEFRPLEEEYDEVIAGLIDGLDRLAAENPDPGRSDTIRRLTRTEYRRAIRDLLELEIDVSTLLPKDESSHGFDNITLGTLSPTLLNRYVSAAEKISRIAVGADPGAPLGRVVRVPPDLSQNVRIEGLPFGTRGGALVEHTFPVAGEYEVELSLTRDRNEHVEGLTGEHQLDLFVDGERVERFTVKRPPDRDFDAVDKHLRARLRVEGGPARIGVAFLDETRSLIESVREPFDAEFNYHRHPRQGPALYQVTINGPFRVEDGGESPSRRRIFHRMPESAADEEPCAEEVLSRLMRLAYRRPVDAADLERPMAFFREGRAEGGFERGIERALAAVLVSPRFLLRVEREPADLASGEPYHLDDLSLATRLAFFLWSSLPDEELLALAERGELSAPGTLEAQVERMLADPRSDALVENFADQWLHLRNLDGVQPDGRAFPGFDDNLRRAFRRETELHFAVLLREDRPLGELLQADHTWLNERLAHHYGIPGVRGSHFRRVELGPDSRRGGLLRHGSVLAVTSYANRTSPVIRGHWVLENILGTPPPPPPPDIPALEDDVVSADLPIRERLARHNADPACSSCHDLMDPVGFAFENYDAVGRWREHEKHVAVDARGGLPDGSEFVGLEGLESALLERSDLFARTFAEKLLTYALGRGVEPADTPAIRKILRNAADSGYRPSKIIEGIVRSVPFTMRTKS